MFTASRSLSAKLLGDLVDDPERGLSDLADDPERGLSDSVDHGEVSADDPTAERSL